MGIFRIKTESLVALIALFCLAPIGGHTIYSVVSLDDYRGHGVVRIDPTGRKLLVKFDSSEHRIYEDLEAREVVGINKNGHRVYDRAGITLKQAHGLRDGDRIVYGWNQGTGNQRFGMVSRKLLF